MIIQLDIFRIKGIGKYYGTVKIGDHWWMSENLDYRMVPKQGLPNVQKCYNDDPSNCDKYGALYAIEFVMSLEDYYGDSLCPEFWHIPSKSEMDDLIKNVESPNGMEALRPSGSSGFNALFSGFIIYQCFREENGRCTPRAYFHRDMYFATHFFTTLYRPNRVYRVQYTLNIQKNYAELYPFETDMQGYYSLRCVKD